jgi:hypothetical protein
VTEHERRGIDLLLGEPEIVAWLGAEPTEHEGDRVLDADDPDASRWLIG